MRSNQEIFNSLEAKLRRSHASCLIFTEDDYLQLTSRDRLKIKHLSEMKILSQKQGFLFRQLGDGIFFATKQRAKELLN